MNTIREMFSVQGIRRAVAERPWIGFAVPFVLALLILLPRIASAQFGLFDDAVSIRVARQVLDGSWSLGFEAAKGRFRPLYWLYHALVYAIVGENPRGFFVANLVLLLLVVAGLLVWVRRLGGSPALGIAAASLFVLAGPVIESYYTLSKGEPLQTVFLLAALILATGRGRPGRPRLSPGATALVTLSLLAADLVKETSVIVLPIAGSVWLLLMIRRPREATAEVAGAATFGVGAGLSTALFFVLQSAASGRSVLGTGYSNGYLAQEMSLGYSGLLWGRWLLRDFSHMIPLIGLGLVAPRILRGQMARRFLLLPAVWAAGWVGVYVPWDFHVEYYLLPMVLGYCLIGAYLLTRLLSDWNSSERPSRRARWASAAVAAPLFLMTLVNNQSNGRLQLVVDRVNAALLASLADLPPQGSLFVNIPGGLEYVTDIRNHLQVFYGRGDVHVDGFRFQTAAPEGPQEFSYRVITPRLDQSFLLSVRLGVYEAGARNWDAALRSFLGPSAAPRTDVREGFSFLAWDPAAAVCLVPALRSACPTHAEILAGGDLLYQWQSFDVTSRVEDLDLPGVFSGDGVWSLRMPDGSTSRIAFGSVGDQPVVGDWDGDGFDGIGVYRPGSGEWRLDNDLDGTPDLILPLSAEGELDIAVAGDWDGDGKDTPGFYSPSTGDWSLWEANNVLTMLSSAEGGQTLVGGRPIAGDWDGDGVSGIGLYRPSAGEVRLENPPDPAPVRIKGLEDSEGLPVGADWAGLGVDTVAFFLQGEWRRILANCTCPPSNRPEVLAWGVAGDIPVAGHWRPGAP